MPISPGYGLQMDMDINASINMLKKGRAGLARTYAHGDGGQYIPIGNATPVEELRTTPTNAGKILTFSRRGTYYAGKNGC